MSKDLPSTPAPHEDDFDRGVRNRRKVLGDAWVDRSLHRGEHLDEVDAALSE